ncbi:MAG: hypothetical protein QM697_13075 [Lachnospiraceae bacterium]
MLINGLSQYDLFSAYNSSNAIDRIPEINSQVISEQGKHAAGAAETVRHHESVEPLALNLEAIRPRSDASLENISLSLKSNGDFEMKGRDSSLSTLDVEKAVSDMQKDQALLQYQYFVGDSNIIGNDEDGAVLQKVPQSL